MVQEFEDVAAATKYVGVLGLSVLSIWSVLLCLSGVHKLFAWLAAFTLLGWLWYFIDLHRVRYSHAGQVCFGDVGVYADDSDVYLLDEGTFLKYMIVSQWLFLSLLAFGIISNVIVSIMARFDDKLDAASK
mmetsp:Transcript_9542/g.13013  ORF Transcript_9542/g.13013 Transcript_9542/m.13013 type:complete len:131 (+) Transcript_9542:70-462(+)